MQIHTTDPQSRRTQSFAAANSGQYSVKPELYALVQHGGRGEGIAFPFIKIYERECDTLTPDLVLYQCGKPCLTGD